MSYKSVWGFGRAGKANYGIHNFGEYPSKIRPIVIRKVVERFSKKGETILDPFCGGSTVAIEAKLQGRSSINYDINPKAIELTKKRLDKLDKIEMQKTVMELIVEHEKELQRVGNNMGKIRLEKEIKKLKIELQKIKTDNPTIINTTHIAEIRDARKLDLPDESVDAIITDIPYAGMIKYSEEKNDLSRIENYNDFLIEIRKAFEEMWRVMKKGKYCIIFVADYRIGASRKILPVHSDVIQIMREIGFVVFDIYIWRYYRSVVSDHLEKCHTRR